MGFALIAPPGEQRLEPLPPAHGIRVEELLESEGSETMASGGGSSTGAAAWLLSAAIVAFAWPAWAS